MGGGGGGGLWHNTKRSGGARSVAVDCAHGLAGCLPGAGAGARGAGGPGAGEWRM